MKVVLALHIVHIYRVSALYDFMKCCCYGKNDKDASEPENPARQTVGNIFNPITLDISCANRENINVYESTYNYLTYGIYQTRVTNSITEVSDGPNIIWKASEGEYCIHAWTYSTYDNILCRISVIRQDLIVPVCLERVNNRWNVLEYWSYFKKLGNMINSQDRGVRIDCVHSSNDLVNSVDFTTNGFLTKHLFPHPQYKVKSVYSDRVYIWESEDEAERCVEMRLYTNLTIQLCSIRVERRGYTLEFYFEKDGQEWKKIDGQRLKSILGKNNKQNG